jgi:hypothetical protein
MANGAHCKTAHIRDGRYSNMIPPRIRIENNALLVVKIHTSAYNANQIALEGLQNELV